MRIGIGFNGAWVPLRTAVELSKQAEQVGYDSAWIAEDGWFTGRDAISTLACVGTGTERIGIGTNLIPPHHARHLHLLAATVAAVDEISQGRLMLGIGAGTRWPSYPANARPLKMMRDAILGLRALLAGQEFDLGGQTLKLQRPDGPFCWDLLPQVRPRVPIYLGARGPRTTKLAGELADGILIEMYVASTEIPVRLRNFELGARQAGRDLNELNVVCNMHTFASADGKVDNRMRAQIAYYLGHVVSDEVATRAGLDLGAVAAVRTAVESNGHWEAASLVSREMVDAFCVAGTPEMCLSKLREYKAAGVKHAILLPIGGDLNLALEIGAEYAKEDQNDA